MIRPRRGFALLSTLAILASLAAVALAASESARTDLSASRNRIELRRAHWLAEGCLAVARAAIDAALASADAARGASPWDSLDHRVDTARTGCELSLRPVGLELDVGSASEEQLLGLLRAASVREGEADSMAAALADWRDADDVPRGAGAERGWYRALGRQAPRNAAIASRTELLRVRGFDRHPTVVAMLGVEAGRVLLERAPLPVVAAVSGVSPEVVAALATMRASGRIDGDVLAQLLASMPGGGARYADFARGTTATSPDAWLLTAVARSGEPAAASGIELRLVRAGARAAVVRRRLW